MRLAPSANATEKTSSGTIRPSAAALIALVGTSARIVCAAVGAPLAACGGSPARSAAAAAGSIGSHAKIGGMTAIAIAATAVSSTTNSARARPPARPTVRGSSAPAMLTMTFETTSGMIVIRIALIQSVPTTSIADPNASSAGCAEAAMAAPAGSPASRPIRA